MYSVISLSDGCGVFASSDAAAIICPLWQYPHCGTSSAIHACCNGCKPFEPSPSMVLMFLPPTCDTGVVQERVSAPSTWTLHAPHNPAPQPNFVPVSCKVSRRTQSRGVSAETSTVFAAPFTFRAKVGMGGPHNILDETAENENAAASNFEKDFAGCLIRAQWWGAISNASLGVRPMNKQETRKR